MRMKETDSHSEKQRQCGWKRQTVRMKKTDDENARDRQ